MTFPNVERTANAFITLMEHIWDTPCEPNADGGLIVYSSTLYDQWANANRVARELGAQQTGCFKMPDGKNCYVYIFPDGTRAKVPYDGSACMRTHHRFTPKRRRRTD